MVCSHCGKENDDTAKACRDCGTSLTEPPQTMPLVTPDRMAGEMMTAFWQRVGVERLRPYFAAFVICFLAAMIGVLSLPSTPDKAQVLLIPFLGLVGVGAVWLLFL